MLAIKLCVSVLALTAQANRVVESSASFRAKLWLKTHEPSGDEAGMQDLKNSDPNAFAIVQALLTKKSLGLLDPSHPNAAFGASSPRKHKSFQEEAEQAGLTQDAPSAAVSEMEMHSSMPYPSVGASAQPYPQVHTSQWNSHTTHSDDDLIASVVGDEPAPVAQPESDSTLSLSATSQEMQQSMPAPVERVAPVAPATNALSSFGMPSLSWGNPMTGAASEAPVTAAAQPAQESSSEQILSLSAVRNQEEQKMGITESQGPTMTAAEAAVVDAPVAASHSALEKDSGITLPSMNWERPSQDTAPTQESLASIAAPVVQPAPVVTNSYLTDSSLPSPAVSATPLASNQYLTSSDLSSSTTGMDAESASEKRLGMSSFHAHMSSYRMNMHANDATPMSSDILSLRKQNMGNSYDSFLKQARTNRWKRAMDVTLNMKPVGGVSNNAYLQDLTY